MFPIVGIGASAGGLEASRNFFRAIPADSGMAFVLIQHLDPTHESLTAELLGKQTTMRVEQVVTTTAVQPNHVYVIPPNKLLSIGDGTLRLTALGDRRGGRMPIDHFLRSLAAARRERAIGIILSGTGTDGTLGLKEIKGAGGMVMVQDPRTARYDGMPRSAIASGAVDLTLPVEAMPDALLQYVRHPYVRAPPPDGPADAVDDGVDGVVALLRGRVNFDFSLYNRGTLTRRLHRRMGLRHIQAIGDYLRLLREDADEARALFKDLLIGVTSFFREPEVWRVLEREVLPQLIRDRDPRARLRAWVPGCATGEEAYGVAMLLAEAVGAAQKSCELQVFASDVDRDALDFARAGLYPESIAADVSPDRLRRFFAQGEHAYRVRKELRESVIFAAQNLITDPPFSKLDLISCRNLLIYLQPEVQRKVIALLHFALAEGGYLVLGSAETIGPAGDLFEPVSKKWRIFRRIGPTRHERLSVPLIAGPESGVTPAGPKVPVARVARLGDTVQELLLERYAPATVVVNRRCEILYFSGRTADYLVQPSGPPTSDLIAQAREGLQTKLRGAVHKAIRENQRVVLRDVRVRRHRASHPVTVTIEPLKVSRETEGLMLVTFAPERETTTAPRAAVGPAQAEVTLARELEHELETTRDDLQSTIEELTASNEELGAANEEVMSVNEELQSTNEELETSKEELQSLNEELNTVNAQLQDKVQELERLNNDLDNLLTSTNIPTVFLDRQFSIRRFTPSATRLFSLLRSDVGRSIRDIAQKFADPNLLDHAQAVLDQLSPISKEIQADDGRWYVRQILPYRTQDNRIDGVVLTFSDVAADALQEARLFAERIVRTVRHPLLVLDAHLRVQSANRSFYEHFHRTPADTEQRLLGDVGNHEWNIPDLASRLAQVLRDKKPLDDFEVTHAFGPLGLRSLLLSARVMEREGARPALILVALEDVTDRKRLHDQLRESEAAMRAVLETAGDAIITIDEHGLIQSVNPAADRMFGYPAAALMGQNLRMLMPAPYRDEHDGYLARYVATGVAHIIGIGREVLAQRRDGTVFPVDLAVSEFDVGRDRRFTGIIRDITERKRIAASLQREQAELQHVLRVSTAGELAAGLAHEITQPLSVIANNLEACRAHLGTERRVSGEVLQLLDHATQESIRAGQILHRLREFMKRREPAVQVVDLRELVRTVVRLLEYEIHQHRITVRLDLGAHPLPVRADSIQIEQVIMNLARNAIDATRDRQETERVIVMRVRRTRNRMAELAVTDTGTGLSAEAIEHLFDPFFTTKADGLGMGLVISRSIIEACGGDLAVEPRKGRPGTVARFTLPLGAEPT